MACRLTSRYHVIMLDTVNPRYRDVVHTYAEPQSVRVETVSPNKLVLHEDISCLVVQSPNYFGFLEDLTALRKETEAKGILLIVVSDLVPLGMLKPPGEYGADIVVGECQSVGINASYGGPYVGYFTCKEKFVRQMPGRVVGRTVDTQGRNAYVLTLQTREQHIRRERATSNICTSEALIATQMVIYLAAVGKQGFKQVAEQSYHKAHHTAQKLAAIPGFSLVPSGMGIFFNEFVVRCPIPPAELNRKLLEQKILGGIDVSDQIPNGLLVCVTETNSKAEIDKFVTAAAAVGAHR